MTKDRLLAFNERVKEAFLAKRIKAPVHFCDPAQAEPLIEIFKDIRPQDYIFCTWRSAFHCLLKGWPEEDVFQAILDGRSMYMCSKKYRIISSSIVGGILPIACGVALGVKMRNFDEIVYVFVGDMAIRSGQFFEFIQYCQGHELPVRVILENNGLSTDTPTAEVWGSGELKPWLYKEYQYNRTEAHVGVAGKYVQF